MSRDITQTVDEEGGVVKAVIREPDWRTKKPRRPVRVAFSYDSKGRLVEQSTDPYDFEAVESEHELPPGKIVITYDDLKQTKKTVYAGEEGIIAPLRW